MDEIKYTLRGVSIDQFATLFEPSGDNIKMDLTIPIRSNYQECAVAVGANIKFLENDKPFLIIEVLCHYVIEDACWSKLTGNNTKDAIIPNDLICNLARMAISTSRGALCAKTENTPFAKYILPIVELHEIQGGDVVIPMDPSNETR